MNEPIEQPAGYTPPPPSLPVVQAAPPPRPVSIEEVPAQTEIPTEATTVEISTEAALNEWIISILKDAVTYPKRKHGWSILAPSALLTIAMSIVSMVPILGPIAYLCLFGYLAAYYFDIIGTSVNGDESLPEWPAVSNLAEDVIWPAMRIFGLCFISFSPTILYSLAQGAYTDAGLIGSLLSFISAAYFPMACIAVVMTDSLTEALPHRVLPAIKRCLPEYFMPVVVLIFIKVVTVLIQGVATFVLPTFLSAILISLITFYGLIMQARITGLTCQRFLERIQWG